MLVNTTSTTVGWVVLLQTGILSKNRIARLKEIKQMEADGTFEVLPKKEVALLNKQRARLEKFLGWYRRYASYSRCNLHR